MPLLVVYAVALATPYEPLHLPGIHNGGDYDSVVHSLVLALADASEGPDLSARSLAPATECVTAGPSTSRLALAVPSAPSRAPPSC